MAGRGRFLSKIFRERCHGENCLYCGETATTDEHFPPHSLTLRGWIFPACFECNVLAGVKFPTDLARRIAYVKARLKNRYARDLRHPHWSAREMIGMSENFVSMIQLANDRKGRIQNRIGWDAQNYLHHVLKVRDPTPMKPKWRRPVVIDIPIWRKPVVLEFWRTPVIRTLQFWRAPRILDITPVKVAAHMQSLCNRCGVRLISKGKYFYCGVCWG